MRKDFSKNLNCFLTPTGLIHFKLIILFLKLLFIIYLGHIITKKFFKYFEWLFANFIMPLLKLYFYITTSNCKSKKIVFYRKEVWAAVVNRATLLKVQKGLWIVADNFLPDDSVLFSVRFFPKKNNDVRSIMKFKNKSFSCFDLPEKEVCKILTLLSKLPTTAGYSTSGYSDINSKWISFQQQVQNKCENIESLYYFTTDIKKCFDYLPVKKLLSILKFTLKKNSTLDISSVCEKYKLLGSVSERIFCHIKHILSNTYVEVSHVYFKLARGIVQGCSYSSALCNIFYGFMESKLADKIIDNHQMSFHLCLRYLDF